MADNPKRQSLVGGGLERATLPFSGFQRAEPFGGYEVEKKSGERLPPFFLGGGKKKCVLRTDFEIFWKKTDLLCARKRICSVFAAL